MVNAASLIVALTCLLSTYDFAENHQTWNRVPVATVAMFAQVMPNTLPALYSLTTSLVTGSVTETRRVVREITAAYSGHLGHDVHSAFQYAVMLYIWSTTDSAHQAHLFALMFTYINTPDAGLAALRDRVRHSHLTPFSSMAGAAAFTVQQIPNTPGYNRLNPYANPYHFTEHWLFFWELVVALLCRQARQLTPADILRSLHHDNFEAQRSDESASAFFSRVYEVYSATHQQLADINCAHLLPDIDSLDNLVFQRASLSLSKKVKWLLENKYAHYRSDDLTFAKIIDLFCEAEKLDSNRHTHDGLSTAIKERSGESRKKPPADAPRKPPGGGKPGKPPYSQQSADVKTPGGPAPGARADGGGHDKRPRERSTASFVPNPHAGSTKEQTDALRAKWREDKVCNNCGGVSGYPYHTWRTCPCKRLDGQDWPADHIPVAPSDTKPPAYQPPPVAAPAVFVQEPAYDSPEDGPPQATHSVSDRAELECPLDQAAEPPVPLLSQPPPSGSVSEPAPAGYAAQVDQGAADFQPILHYVATSAFFVLTLFATYGKSQPNVTLAISGIGLVLLACAHLVSGNRKLKAAPLVLTAVAVAAVAACAGIVPDSALIGDQKSEFGAVLPTIASAATPQHTHTVGVFNAFTGKAPHSSHRITVGPDSFADITLIAPAAVHPKWNTVTVPQFSVRGIGGLSSPVSTAVQVPIRLQYGAPLTYIYAYIGATPSNVDLLMGCDVLDFLGAEVNRKSFTTTFSALGLAVPMATVTENLSRVAAKPMSVLATCSGCNLAYATVRNLGFSVKRWFSIETDPGCREVTKRLIPPEQLREPCHDVTAVPAQFWQTHIDLHINTSPCQPFSRLQTRPAGFKDVKRSQPMVSSAELHRRLRRTNPHIRKLVENVRFHHSLTQDAARFRRMWDDTPVELNAKHYGSPSARPRQYMADFVNLHELHHQPPLSPNAVLSTNRFCDSPHMPCIVAAEHTYNVPTVTDTISKRRTRLTIGECEQMMGWPAGITRRPSCPDEPYATQLQRIGNALNNHQLHHILKHLHRNLPASAVWPVQVEMLTAEDLETQLASLTDAQLITWVRSQIGDWEPEALHLRVKPGQRPFGKPRRGYSVPPGLHASMRYAIDDQIRKGYLRKVQYTSDMFISQGFCQVKPDRYYPGTDIPMVRLLADCRALNQACVDSPHHHFDCCPTQLDMASRVPLGATHYRYYDLSDAFHTCKIADDSAHLVVVQFNGEFYQYVGGAQGIANMAVHWNIHLTDAFDRVLGIHWRDWYTLFVDDLGVHGFSDTQARTRGRVLEAILTVLDKPFSDKTGADYSESLELAGLYFDRHGVRLSDEAFASLEQCLREYPVRSVRDIQHVVGVIQYCYSAFEWPSHTASAEYSDLLGKLTDITKVSPRLIPKAWETAYPPVRDKLLSLMKKRPWAYCDPRSIIDDNHCLVMTTDASDTAVAVTLFRVNKPNAADITKDDLTDPSKSQIIGITYKKLNKAQLKWLTFEAELYAIVLGCTKFGSFITTATQGYPPSGTKKIALWSDSTTALSQMAQLTLPSGATEHLSAKARRFFSWADKVAYTRYWPIVTHHLPGDDNDISHILSHLGEETRHRHNYLQAVEARTTTVAATLYARVFPVQHSFHAPPPASNPLDAYDLVHLNLTRADVLEIQRAYLEDDTLVNEIPLCDIYRVVTKHPSAANVPHLHAKHIRAWADKRFFSVSTPHGPLLFAPSACTVNKYPDATDQRDNTRHLVTVIPKGAQVKITTALPVVEGHATGNHWADHDMRRDLLIHCHDNSNHPTHADTSKRVRALVWFPHMRRYIEYHCDSCAYCVAKKKAAGAVGTAVRTKRRLKLVEFDHKILEPAVVQATGCAAILTMVDTVSRVTMFIPVKSKDAVCTARAIFTSWYSLFGVPAVFRMDKAAEFSSEVMTTFARMLGVKSIDMSCHDNPTHHGMVERRNKVMEKFLDVAMSKGDIQSFEDLQMYCATAAAACNLEYVFDGHTVLEYLTGEVPRTQRDTATTFAADLAGIGQDVLGSTFVQQLRGLLHEHNDLVQIIRDDDARYAALSRDVTQHSRQLTQFDLRPGDRVSYEGDEYSLLELVTLNDDTPVKAVIRITTHDDAVTKTVKYSDLRPLTDPRPVNMHRNLRSTVSSAKVGDFVFFTTPASPAVHSGLIITHDDNSYSVHQYAQAPKIQTRFTPLFYNSTLRRNECKIKPQTCHSPVLNDITLNDMIVVGSISDTYHVTSQLLDAVRSTGVADEV